MSKTQTINFDKYKDKPWEDIKAWKGEAGKERVTGVNLTLLKDLGDQITKLPSDLVAHKQIQKIYELRNQSIQTGEGIDWGTAE